MSAALFKKLELLVEEIGSNNKTASALSEPDGNGATGSDSQHPSKSMDDGLVPATTGSLAAEKSKEVKDLGPGSIDAATAPAADKPAESREANVGLTVSGVGNDSATEDGYVDKLKEPGVGTSTGAKFDDGHKYAAADFMKLSSDRRNTHLTNLANDLLADIVTTSQKQASSPASGTRAETEALAAELVKEAQAGYELAAAIGMEKMSNDQRVAATLHQTVCDAVFDADLVGAWFKQAAEMGPEAGLPPGEGLPPELSAGGPPGAGLPPGDPEGAGGPPPEAVDQALGEATAGGGGQPAGPSKDEVMQELLMAMQEMGITPEELMQVAAAGGPPPGAGGPPPEPDGDEMPEGEQKAANAKKIASAVREYQRSGKFEFKTACSPRQRSIRDHMKQVLGELVS